MLTLLARRGRVYLTGPNWSQAHWRWSREQRFALPPLQRAFEAIVFALEQALARQAELDKELEAVAATASYRRQVRQVRGVVLTGRVDKKLSAESELKDELAGHTAGGTPRSPVMSRRQPDARSHPSCDPGDSP